MGSPISVVAAELTMQQIEKKILADTPWPVKLWRRYVDDTIVVLPKNNIGQFTNFINSVNTDIQFTCEVEQNGKLPFLDITIIRSDNGELSFDVYRKPTHTNRYLDNSSCHPK